MTYFSCRLNPLLKPPLLTWRLTLTLPAGRMLDFPAASESQLDHKHGKWFTRDGATWRWERPLTWQRRCDWRKWLIICRRLWKFNLFVRRPEFQWREAPTQRTQSDTKPSWSSTLRPLNQIIDQKHASWLIKLFAGSNKLLLVFEWSDTTRKVETD